MYRSFLKRIPTIRTSVAGDRSLPHPVWPPVVQKAHNRPPTFPNKPTFTITPKPKVWKKVCNGGSTNGGPKHTIEEPTVQAKQKDEWKAVERLGAAVVLVGDSYDEVEAYVVKRAKEEGRTFVPPFDHPDVIISLYLSIIK
ncbi:hypothetical protein POM88_028769 [Heracleum sosnowskyi]|uniref:Uncharacterized protein n=1 Tax=Heracleum sosnowskyi TaxID=360622 RepID=A0AAD8HSV5_9APIA|nr:hypothetical protein POM88_028769 [Heracleum sosnowskyi]